MRYILQQLAAIYKLIIFDANYALLYIYAALNNNRDFITVKLPYKLRLYINVLK